MLENRPDIYFDPRDSSIWAVDQWVTNVDWGTSCSFQNPDEMARSFLQLINDKNKEFLNWSRQSIHVNPMTNHRLITGFRDSDLNLILYLSKVAIKGHYVIRFRE